MVKFVEIHFEKASGKEEVVVEEEGKTPTSSPSPQASPPNSKPSSPIALLNKFQKKKK